MIGRALAAAAAFAGAGCAPVLDPARLALCRDVLPALHEPGTILSNNRDDPGDGGIKITYLAERPGRPRTIHTATCRFDGTDRRGRPDLVGLVVDGRTMSPVRLYILKRWWLDEVRPEPARAVDFRFVFPDLAGVTVAPGAPP